MHRYYIDTRQKCQYVNKFIFYRFCANFNNLIKYLDGQICSINTITKVYNTKITVLFN